MNILGNYPTMKVGGKFNLDPTMFVGYNLPILWGMAGLEPRSISLRAFDGAKNGQIFAETGGTLFINNNALVTDIIAIQMKGGNLFGALWGMMGEYVRSVYVTQASVSPEDYLNLDVSRRAGMAPPYLDEVAKFLESTQGEPDHELRVDRVVVGGIVNALFTNADIGRHDVDETSVKSILTARRNWVNPTPFLH